MKKLVGDFAYILLVLALVFGGIRFAFPSIDVDLTSAPLAPPVPAYVEEIEALAVYLDEGLPPTITVLVLNFWSSNCEYCKRELLELKIVAQYRMDIGVVSFTTEIDSVIVDTIIEELDLNYAVLYGLPEAPPLNVPNTHVLMRDESGVWKVLSKGTWIGFVEAETITQFIVDNTTE